MGNSSADQTLDIGGVIRLVRLAIQMSQQDLAIAMGVHWITVHRWEAEGKAADSNLCHLRELLRRPMLRLRLWRSADAETVAVRAGLVEPMRDYAKAYARGARQLLKEGFAAELSAAD